MPREFSIVQKRKWLEAFEKGETPRKIADDGECDVRTVRKGIEEALWERETNLRRGELIREALTNHNVSLINLLKGLMPSLIPLPVNQHVPWKDVSPSNSIDTPGGKVEYVASPYTAVKEIKLDIEEKPEWELLDEHLHSTDPLKKSLNTWKKSIASHIEARINFKRNLATALTRETGLRMLEKPSSELKDLKGELPFIDPFAVDVLTQELLSHLISSRDIDDFSETITITDQGEVRYSNAPLLAYTPHHTDECKASILRVMRQQDISQDTSLINTYRTMEEATGKARRAVQELLLLGLIPGRCRICRRLGL
jgi:hypothetical protein